MAPPSALPSAQAIVEVFLRRIVKGIAGDDLVARITARRPLPEYVYGTCERYFDNQVYRVWSGLELWRDFAHLGPNAGHRFVIASAAHAGTPVLTPNFDSMLEAAAIEIGLEPIVSLAIPGERFSPVRAGPGQVAIWKLHGTASDPSTVFSSVRALTSPTRGLVPAIRTALTQDSLRLVLAGYSGRDLDLFPVIADLDLKRAPMWLDLAFDHTHRSRYLRTTPERVRGSFNDVALMMLSGKSTSNDGVLHAGSSSVSPDFGADCAKLARGIERHVESVADALNLRDCRRLVLGEISINSGLASDALDLLAEPAASGILESERARLKAKALWELGRFYSSKSTVVTRLTEVPRKRWAERATLRFAVAVADARLAIPGVSIASGWRLTVARILPLAAKWWWPPVGYLPALLPARVSTVPEPIRTPLIEAYLEHLVRMLAVVQRLVLSDPIGRRLAGLVALILGPAWNALSRLCARFEYTEGIGNCARYEKRLLRRRSISNGAVNVHEFLGHHLGMAIALRDQARTVAAGGGIAEASRLFGEALEMARQQGDPVLFCSVVESARSVGMDLEVGETSIMNQLEAPWVDAAKNWLANGPQGR